ncbi:MAG: hypothetical protein JO362_06930 [Streptomycetaceae bacterium]|nr:hypothetical protein [Streptomycetaceae bacterium]
MSDWTWEYEPDAENVVGGLPSELVEQVAQMAQRLADAAGVKYIGDPPIEESGVSKVFVYTEGILMLWYQEDRRYNAVYILQAIPWPG